MVVPALWLKDIDVTSLFQLWFRPSLFPWRPWEIMKLFREVLSHLELLDKRRWGRSTKEIWGVWLYIHLQTLDITHLVHHSIHTSSLSTPTSFMTSKGIGGLRPPSRRSICNLEGRHGRNHRRVPPRLAHPPPSPPNQCHHHHHHHHYSLFLPGRDGLQLLLNPLLVIYLFK